MALIGWFRDLAARRKVRRRLADMCLRPSSCRTPLAVPDVCPICGLSICGPVFRFREITPSGERELLMCETCKILGPLESIITAAAERQAAAEPSRSDPAHLVGSHPEEG